MLVGLSVEDRTQEAVLRGLVDRWCPRAHVFAVPYRGQSKQRRRAQLRGDFEELVRRRKCDCIVILRDADETSWPDAVKDEEQKLPRDHGQFVVIGAPTRNIECWLSADPADFVAEIGGNETQLRKAREDDPKGPVQGLFRRKAGERGIRLAELIEGFVNEAPLAQWLRMSCFNAFYEACQQLATDMECDPLPNERDSKTRVRATQ